MSTVMLEKIAADPRLLEQLLAILLKNDPDSLDGRLALSVVEASKVVGVGRDAIDDAIRAGELRPAYPTSKGIVPVRYLKEWLFALPDVKP